MDSPFKRIGIVGSGAIGIYYGARLARAGAEVRFLMRRDLQAVRQRGSILIHEDNRATEVRPVQVFANSAEIGPVDLVVVALKTTLGAEAQALVQPLLGDATAILTLQNGLGPDEFLAGLFGAERIVGGLVFMAVTRTAPGEVTCFHPGSVSLGEFGRPAGERIRAIADLLQAGGIKTQVVDNILEARWRKLVWNIPFNGLSIAEGGITTDKICADPELAREARELMLEVRKAAAGFGFKIPDRFIEKQFEVTPLMGPYQPSSLVDFLAGREVEVESIWGEPLRRSKSLGVETPRLEALYQKLLVACRRQGLPLNPRA